MVVGLALGFCAGCAKAPPASAPAGAEESKADAPPPRTPPSDAVKTASGLASQVRKPGRGEQHPELHDKVRVHFIEWKAKTTLADKLEKRRAGPVTFAMTGVIAGWTEALQQMRVGEERRLWIPDELVYPGRSGYPRADAVFDLELVEIIDGKPPLPAPADLAAAPADATRTSSGLTYKLLAKGGSEERPHAWDRVSVHYTGWTADGAMFASSHGDERPSIFDVGKVMPGWTEALQLLAIGDRARLWIPEALAYQGRSGEPKGSLVYDLELVSIERLPEPPRPPDSVARAPRDAKRTRSGLYYRVLRKGEGGIKPKATDHVEVHYSAWTTDGALFDSSVVRGKPARVPVSRVIPGWAEGLQLMAVGDKAQFWIPEQLAYAGREGSPQGMLVYEVELLKVAP